MTDSELSTFLNNTWTGPNYDPMIPNSCNDIITNRTINVHTYLNPFISGMINLSGFRSIYLTSSTLSNFNTLGAKGENNIIKKGCYGKRLWILNSLRPGIRPRLSRL